MTAKKPEHLKKKGGRPRKNPDVLPKSWDQKALAIYEKGGCDVEVKALIYRLLGKFSNDLWERWMKEEPGFSDTIKLGRMLSESWWRSKGRCNTEQDKGDDVVFNTQLYHINMKNRFNWSDKQEVKQETVEVKVEAKANKAITERIQELIGK